MARSLRVGGAMLIVALAVIVAGCGGASSPSSSGATTPRTTTTPTTTNGSGTQSAAFKTFQTCLANAGIKTNFGGGGRPGGGGTPPAGGTRPTGGGFGGARNLTAAQQKAFTACRAKLPAGFTPGRGAGGPNGGTANPALAKYTTCLKQHGVTLGASTKAATFKKASAACAKYAPAGSKAQ